MVRFASALSLRVPGFHKRKLSRSGIASFLATAVLVAAPVAADARITQIQILNRGTAFGGYSFPGVGQYEFITGIATGEVNPTNPQNAVITDIQLAPRKTRGNVVYQHNFYILKPLDLSKGNHKMMYEPPNRGGKTYQTLNNTPTGTNDPAALTDPTVLDNSFLWTRGYTTVWSGWENNLGPLSGLTATADRCRSSCTDLNNATLTGPGYEYIVTGAATFTLAYPPASADQKHGRGPDPSRPSRRPPPVVPTSGWAYTDASNHRDQVDHRDLSSTTTSTSSPTSRRIRR